ncbi:hypothetical protein CUZ96_1281 [Enterococcus lactis]|nr:hypothetical protein [Enterococcus lactis]
MKNFGLFLKKQQMEQRLFGKWDGDKTFITVPFLYFIFQI